MTSLWFVVPVHGRHRLTTICLRQLRRTCDALAAEGIDATAVVIGDGTNIAVLQRKLGVGLLGFAWIERDNEYLSRKFNDGIQLAFDKRFNTRPADYVVPCGSDDWVDHRLFTELPRSDTMVGFQVASFVREDGREIVARHLRYEGGVGIRIWPRELFEPFEFRPADEDRKRACDTSILMNTRAHWKDQMRVVHRPVHHWAIVDWKSPTEQLNSFGHLNQYRVLETADPFEVLRGIYPEDSLEDMRQHYGVETEVAA